MLPIVRAAQLCRMWQGGGGFGGREGERFGGPPDGSGGREEMWGSYTLLYSIRKDSMESLN